MPRFFVCFTKELELDILWRDELDQLKDDDIIKVLKLIKSEVDMIESSFRDEDRELIQELDEVDPQDRVYMDKGLKFKFTDEAKNYYIEQVREMRRIRRIENNNKITSVYQRAEGMLFKFAMIIHIANLNFNDYTITLDTMKKAKRVVDYSIKNYIQVFTKELQFTPYGKTELKVLKILKGFKGKPVSVREIMRRVGNYQIKKREDLLNFMNVFVEDGECRVVYKMNNGEATDFIEGYQYIKKNKRN